MKNGFTLVEILAVVIILAIIITLVSTNVLNIFTNSKQKTYDEQIQTLIRLAKQYSTEFNNDLIWVEQTGEDTAVITINQLINAGYVEENIVNAKNGKIICPSSFITITDTNNVFTYDITIYNTGDIGC